MSVEPRYPDPTAVLALDLQHDEIEFEEIAVELLEIVELEDDRTHLAAANDPHYPHVRTLAVAPPRTTRVPAPILYEEYHPYGTSAYRAVSSGIEVSAKRYRYTGKERDEETGLDHMGARYSAPWLGRWTSADPIGLGDGVNRYAYVRGNPVGMRDPSGLYAEGIDDAPARRNPPAGVEHRPEAVDLAREAEKRGIARGGYRSADEAAMDAATVLTAFAEADERLYREEKRTAEGQVKDATGKIRKARRDAARAFFRGRYEEFRLQRQNVADARRQRSAARNMVRELADDRDLRGHSVEWASSLYVDEQGLFGFTGPMPGRARQESSPNDENYDPTVKYRQPATTPPSRFERQAAGLPTKEGGAIHSHPPVSDPTQGKARDALNSGYSGLLPSETDRGQAASSPFPEYLVNPRGELREIGESADIDRVLRGGAEPPAGSDSTVSVKSAIADIGEQPFENMVQRALMVIRAVGRERLLRVQR